MSKIDTLILGGAIANTFLLADNYKVGSSLVGEDSINLALEIKKEALKNNTKLLLPTDVVVSSSYDSVNGDEKQIGAIKDNDMILDIGSGTINDFASSLEFAATIFWNGPFGYVENPVFARGTDEIAQAVANASAFSVIGGGDTIGSIDESLKSKFGYVSMAGGASLEFLSGKILPGIQALE